MSIGLPFVRRFPGRDRRIDGLRPLQHIWNIRHIRFRRLFDHAGCNCNPDTSAWSPQDGAVPC